MRKTLITMATSAALLGGLATTASAGGSPGSIGVGAEYTLLGVGGASVNYDAGDFHAGGFFGFRDDDTSAFDNTTIELGGRFYYHLHSTAMSDFSLGAALGVQYIDVPDPADDATNFYIDLGVQIRAFVVSNVALSAGVGLGLVAAEGDNDGFAITGDLVGVTGIHYYFF